MFAGVSRRFKIAVAGVVSAASMGLGGYVLLGEETAFTGGLPGPVSLSSVTQKEPLSVAAFKSHVARYSQDNLLVVLLRRDDCAVCPGVRAGLEEARYRMQKKFDRGFAVYELNADQNAEVAGLLRQRDPAAEARLHVFYNGAKIYESVGISDNALHLFDVIENVQALADGAGSAYDKYEPSDIFAASVTVKLPVIVPILPPGTTP